MKGKVCFLFSAFPPLPMGGVQRYLIDLTKDLHRIGIHSTLITRYYPPFPRVQKFPFCTVKRIGLNPFPYTQRDFLNKIISKSGDVLTYSVLGYPEAIKAASNSTIIHSQFAIKSDVKLGNRIAQAAKKKHVVTVHIRFGKDVEDYPINRGVISLLSNVDHVIGNRNSTLQILSRCGIENITILDNPISVSEYSPLHKKRSEIQQHSSMRFLFVGRLVERRGPHIALQAFAKAVEINPHIEMWIVGAGKLESSLKLFVKHEGIEEKVRFFGNQEDVRKFYLNADVFLAPSKMVNSPSLALREAMASGLAVIATDVEETKRIVIPNQTGLVCAPTIADLSEAIVRLSYKPELVSNLGSSAASFAKHNFDVRKYVIELLEIYRKTLE